MYKCALRDWVFKLAKLAIFVGHAGGQKIANQNGLDGEYFALADLQARWIHTRQGVHKLTRSKGFPAPALTVSLGRVRLWSRFDIEAFERAHPEVFDEHRKQAKIMRHYMAAISK